MALNTKMYDSILEVIFSQYPTEKELPMYKSLVLQNTHVNAVLKGGELSTASSVVEAVEERIAEITGSPFVAALNSGTSALHMALLAAGVKPGDMVITQALSFVATGNSILYAEATPVFIDVDSETYGMDAAKLEKFLDEETETKNGEVHHRLSGKRISACMPMHTLGFPCEIDAIVSICKKFGITVVEDAAESFGSTYKGQHTGTFGEFGCLSFNGNKIATAGSGGAVLCKTKEAKEFIQHLSTTAKTNHSYEFNHDQLGYNNRMAGINAALLLDQLESYQEILKAKQDLADRYYELFDSIGVSMLRNRNASEPNYWLNTISFNNFEERIAFLDYANSKGVLCRPIWKLLSALPYFGEAISTPLPVSEKLYNTLVSIPSFVTKDMLQNRQ